jgi:hypothetical protein
MFCTILPMCGFGCVRLAGVSQGDEKRVEEAQSEDRSSFFERGRGKSVSDIQA